MPDPEPLTIADAAAALRTGSITSAELLGAASSRADALDGDLGIYVTRFEQQARAAAVQADEELAAGRDRGPLHGIPIGIKDIISTAEGPTTAQSTVLDPAWGRGRDAVVVERLRAAGAIITGKLTTMEFAAGLPDPTKPFPVPRNPWDRDTWPGGSSSGSGAGVAARVVLAALGTDTAGSIRIPALWCGVSGLKPTYGRVPNAGCVPLGYTLDHVGPIARTAQDCALVLQAIEGPDPRDDVAVALPTAPRRAADGLAGLRIGVERAHHLDTIDDDDPAAAPAFDAALETLEGLGAALVEVQLPHVAEAVTASVVCAMCEAFAHHRPELRRDPQRYTASNRALLPLGACFSGADYVQAQRVRRATQRALAAVFTHVDVIAMPGATRVAPPLASVTEGPAFEMLHGVFTQYWDAVGNPALVAPMGFNAAGLPLGLQLAGRPFEDELVLDVGAAYQRATDWHLRLPAADPLQAV